jgi:hypothetical protein
MKKFKLLLAIFVTVFLSSAMADEEINYSLNLKNWNMKVSGCCEWPAANVTNISGTVRKGDYFATASFLLPASLIRSDGTYAFRRDADFALGWSMNSNVSFLGGAKRIGSSSYDFSGSSSSITPNVMNIVYVGVNGFSSLSEKTYVYGTGLRSLKVTQTGDSSTTTFYSYEAGIGYLLEKNVQLSVGFRSQHVDNTDKTTLDGVIFGLGYNF